MLLLPCNRYDRLFGTHLRRKTLGNLESRVTARLSYAIVTESLKAESLSFVPADEQDGHLKFMEGHSKANYPKDTQWLAVPFFDPFFDLNGRTERPFLKDAAKQKALERSLHATAKIMFQEYKDKAGNPRDLSLEDFDVLIPLFLVLSLP